MESKASFWQKNQVLITSIAGALILVMQQFMLNDHIDYKALGLAALTAVAGIIGNEFRGKGLSIAGVLGAVALAFEQIARTGEINVEKIILAVLLGVFGLAMSPFKSIGYEKTDTIKQALKEGEKDVPTPVGPKPDKIIN